MTQLNAVTGQSQSLNNPRGCIDTIFGYGGPLSYASHLPRLAKIAYSSGLSLPLQIHVCILQTAKPEEAWPSINSLWRGDRAPLTYMRGLSQASVSLLSSAFVLAHPQQTDSTSDFRISTPHIRGLP